MIFAIGIGLDASIYHKRALLGFTRHGCNCCKSGLLLNSMKRIFCRTNPILFCLFYKGMARDPRGSSQLDEEMRLTHLSYEDRLEHAFGRRAAAACSRKTVAAGRLTVAGVT